MAKKSYQLTEGEWAIIDAVWDNQPCAAPTVQEKLASRKKWSYSTVKTMMDRMVVKGLLTTERIRNLILYRSAITRKQAQKGEIVRALKRAFDGALTPMMQFLLDSNNLSPEQLDEIENLIKSKKLKVKSEAGQALVMLLFFIMIGITITTAAIFIVAGNSLSAMNVNEGEIAKAFAETGAEKALLQILRGNYEKEGTTLENIPLTGGEANVTITSTNGTATIDSVGTAGNYVKKVRVTVLKDGMMEVTSWKEVN